MKRKQIISGVSTVLCTALVLGLSACGGKTNTPQTIPAVNDTVKDTAKMVLLMLPGSWMLLPRRTHPQNKFMMIV